MTIERLTVPLVVTAQPQFAVAISSVLVIIGLSASFMVLRWLGKSFSIMAEARGARYAKPLARMA